MFDWTSGCWPLFMGVLENCLCCHGRRRFLSFQNMKRKENHCRVGTVNQNLRTSYRLH